MTNRLPGILLLIAWAIIGFHMEANAASSEVDVTVFNEDLGLIRERRTLDLEKGVHALQITDIAERIDPTSVRFECLSHPQDVKVLEQNFEYDLLDNVKLLQKFVGQTISIMDVEGNVYEGILQSGVTAHVSHEWDATLNRSVPKLRHQEQHIILADDPERGPFTTLRLDKIVRISYPELSTGLMAKPTLMWHVQSKRSGKEQCEITYMTRGMKWHADYTVVLSKEDKELDLSGWVTIDNQSGKAYEEARLKLMAGDVRIERPGEPLDTGMRMLKLSALSEERGTQFEEKPFFEYHLYTLQRPATLKDNQTKQIELLTARGVSGKKAYYYDGFELPGDRYRRWDTYSIREDRNFGTTSSKKVAIVLSFQNSAKNQLGMPLPRGKMRVYKRDDDGKPEFVGESSIDHTPKDEEVKLMVGDAFDMVGERVQTFFEMDHSRRMCTESFEITLRNHKDEEVLIHVMEHMYRWYSWEITKKDYRFEQEDARTIRFDVRVPKDEEKKIHYTVEYRW